MLKPFKLALRELVITSLFEEDPPCLGWRGEGVIEDTTCFMNITDKILLALKFELTQKYSSTESQHRSINEKSEV